MELLTKVSIFLFSAPEYTATPPDPTPAKPVAPGAVHPFPTRANVNTYQPLPTAQVQQTNTITVSQKYATEFIQLRSITPTDILCTQP